MAKQSVMQSLLCNLLALLGGWLAGGAGCLAELAGWVAGSGWPAALAAWLWLAGSGWLAPASWLGQPALAGLAGLAGALAGLAGLAGAGRNTGRRQLAGSSPAAPRQLRGRQHCSGGVAGGGQCWEAEERQ